MKEKKEESADVMLQSILSQPTTMALLSTESMEPNQQPHNISQHSNACRY